MLEPDLHPLANLAHPVAVPLRVLAKVAPGQSSEIHDPLIARDLVVAPYRDVPRQ
jgi:hypothetical protein